MRQNRNKINNELLLKMLKEGKSQKEIAKIFSCSEPAISQRLFRLHPPPQSLQKLSPERQKFCLEMAKGKSRIDAVMGSFSKITTRDSAKMTACNLMKEPDIRDLMDYHGLPRSYRVVKLKSHVDNIDPFVSLKALDQSWKLDGSYAPEKHHKHRHSNIRY